MLSDVYSVNRTGNNFCTSFSSPNRHGGRCESAWEMFLLSFAKNACCILHFYRIINTPFSRLNKAPFLAVPSILSQRQRRRTPDGPRRQSVKTKQQPDWFSELCSCCVLCKLHRENARSITAKYVSRQIRSVLVLKTVAVYNYAVVLLSTTASSTVKVI